MKFTQFVLVTNEFSFFLVYSNIQAVPTPNNNNNVISQFANNFPNAV